MCGSCSWEEAADVAEEILSDVQELPERAEDFGQSVDERVKGMLEWIEENEHVTDKMRKSLDNTKEAVGRWLK